MEPAHFTEAVRQELARLPLGGGRDVHAELCALVRVGGRLHVRGGRPPTTSVEVTSGSGAVARRAFVLLQHRYDVRPQVLVQAPEGIRRHSSYRVEVTDRAAWIGRDLGVLDAGGGVTDGMPSELLGSRAVAYLRGAVLAGSWIAAPGRPPHLEITVASPRMAQELAGLLQDVVGSGTPAGVEDRCRVVLKSGSAIGDLLATIGATAAFLRYDDRRLRRQLRSDANRLANADAANLRRTVEAAAAQVRVVESAIAGVGWDALDDDLRAVALARLANPDASLAELGQLVDPAVGKSVVYRRLRRLEQLAERPAG